MKKMKQTAKKDSRFELYRRAADAGFPQGGSGNWYRDPESGNNYYVPHPSEIYTQFVGDPKDWDKLSDAMVKVWLKIRENLR